VIDNFYAFVGIDVATAAKRFNIMGLMQLCEWSLEGAVNLYLSSPDEITSLCPPLAAAKPAKPAAPKAAAPPISNSIQLSCGHVEKNLSPNCLQEVLDLLMLAKAKAIMPTNIDSGYGEIANGNFTIIVPLKSLQ